MSEFFDVSKHNVAIQVENLKIGYHDNVVLENLSFDIPQGEIVGILGNSGCGKSTLLKHLVGLYQPMHGEIKIFGQSIVNVSDKKYEEIIQKFGVTYQNGALLSSLNLFENVALPLQTHTELSAAEIREKVMQALEWVEMADFAAYYPGELSGGMNKRGGLARALIMQPEILFFDEPSAGLDPITSCELDDLILHVREQFKATVVLVTHELESVMKITDSVIVLNKEIKGIAAVGSAKKLQQSSPDPFVSAFLNRREYTPSTST
ncbi:MAG: ATP-binding cassette domain-containing protein [Lentisphaeria bacterium]|nr:ATP-binding cassette domain-containing protein [Lentisphaeria bacterium]